MLQAAITDFCPLVGSRNKLYGKILIRLGLIYSRTFYLFISATNCNCPKLLCRQQSRLTDNKHGSSREGCIVRIRKLSENIHKHGQNVHTVQTKGAVSVSIKQRIIRLNRFLLIHPTDSAQQDQLSLGPSNEL